MFYSIVILLTLLQAESDRGDYIIFMEGPFKNLPYPYNGIFLLLYVFALYFSLSSYAIPFLYRYLLVVKETRLSSSKFYFLYLITASFGFVIAVGVGKSTTWPNYDPANGSEFEQDFDFLWRDEQGRVPIFIASHLKNTGIFITVLSAFGGVLICYMIAGYCCVKTVLHLKELHNSDRLTSDPKLQKQVTYALIGQAAVPCLVGGIPLMLILMSLLTHIPIPRIGVIGISGLAWMTFINPVLAMIFIRPYRVAAINFVRKFILCQKIAVVVPENTEI